MRRSCTVAEAATVAAEVRATVPAAASVADDVAGIVEDVRLRGNAAVASYEARFGDGAWGRVTSEDLAAALEALDPEVRQALKLAAANIAAVASAGLDPEAEVTLDQGQSVRLRDVPVRRAAVYAPGGRAPYPSSVLMGAVTARAAGVDEVVVAAPRHPVILAAAALCRADEVYAMGGAQAIAALAHGTESIPRVDVIVGPGNLYVQEAKRQVSGLVGIDGFAGPSDLCVIVTEAPAWAAADLAAQAEHGPDSLVVAVAADETLLAAAGGGAGRVVGVLAEDLEAALAFAEALAPEHLQLMGADAERLAPRVRTAGCLFVGEHAGTAFGDYVAGSNHTLPTEGAARFASGLNVRHFRRRMAEVRIPSGAATTLAGPGAAIARAEGFEAHAASMEARRENPSR
jgi:histidinol dehydrogenase